MLDGGLRKYEQNVNYFADDARPFGEFCKYDMTFIVYDASSYGFDTGKEHWKTPENGLPRGLTSMIFSRAKPK